MQLRLYPEDAGFSPEMYIFRSSRLGKMHSLIPFKKICDHFRPFRSKFPQGVKPWLSLEGGLGLMFLKSYAGCCSDSDLVERLNSDYQFQLFCGIRLPIGQKISDDDLPGRWRRFFAERLDISNLQDMFADAWKGVMKDTHVLLDDATCYESEVRYPTDVKLLQECCGWLHRELFRLRSELGLGKLRDDKYTGALRRYKKYSRMRRKNRKKGKRLRVSLLYWLKKWEGSIQKLLDRYPEVHSGLGQEFYNRLKIIRIVYSQQLYMHENNVRRVPHRIISLAKPYLRPIVRGKEKKRVEFGAKVNISQTDGINFMEHLSFDAFHEGNRMWRSIARHRRRFGKCSQYGADKIYATNANRRKAKKLKVQTSFIPKGRKAKDERQRKKMRDALSKERATRLEGSFGTEKTRYLGNKRVRARKLETEKVWIFFAIHTANLVRLANRLMPKSKKYKNSS